MKRNYVSIRREHGNRKNDASMSIILHTHTRYNIKASTVTCTVPQESDSDVVL